MIKKQAFEKFCKEINYLIPQELENTFIIKSVLDHKIDAFVLHFSIFYVVDYKIISNFINTIKKNFAYKTIIKFSIENLVYKQETILDYINNLIFNIYKIEDFINNLNKNNFQMAENGVLKIFYTSEHEKNRYQNYQNFIEISMENLGFETFKIIFEKSEIFLQQENDDEKLIADFLKNQNLSKNIEEKKSKIFKSSSKKMYKKTVKELYDTFEQDVYVEAYVVDKKIFETKNKNLILTITISDNTEAIKLRRFFESKDQLNSFDITNIGDFIVIEGKVDFDTFNKEKIIYPKTITISKDKKESSVDMEIEKRIELSIRTTMSTMDGFKEADDFVSFAKQLNHESLAIVDIDSVQSFPNFFNAVKKANIKGIYGASFSTIFKNNQAIKNLKKNTLIKNETYVVFDLETTGLSPIFDDIIEFGAQKILNGKVIDTLQFFVKPNKEISEKITLITGIKNQDVENAISEKEALKKILEFMGDHTVVAHNATFDMNFINEKIEKYNFQESNLQIIDTLVVSKIIEPEAKKFSLENLASRSGIIYNSTEAHRADYDADVLAKVWNLYIQKLSDMNVKYFDDIYNFKSNIIYEKTRPFEITILAKNQSGLKELFQKISLTSTKQYFNGPKMFFEDLLEKSKNILIGSGTLKSLIINEVFRGTRKGLREYLKYFDYVEIIPPKNFSHWIKNEDILKEELLEGLKILVEESKKLNKIVVAVGDVRYVQKDEKILHEIYINAKGLQGIRHPLFKYDQSETDYPTLNYLNTQEMIDQFLFLQDNDLIKEIVVKNTHLISNQIENNIEVIKKDLFTPKIENSANLLRELVYAKAFEIYGKNLPELIISRIEKELNPIIEQGYDVIYWISHKIVAKSLEDGYIVGSRGSVGSSLVAYLSGITEVNPLPPHYICSNCKDCEFIKNLDITSGYDLPHKNCNNCYKALKREGQTIPFETFLGFGANKVPDIDLNFSNEYQHIVHDEVRKWFGEDHCFRAGTISKTADKTAYGYVLAWAEENNLTFSNAFIGYLASKIVGTKRTTGQHPGGIIVIPKDFSVEDFTPINFPANDPNSSWKTTHFDFHAIHDNVLKLDLLGHNDPTAIKFLTSLTNVNVFDIPFNDEKVLSLFTSTKALNIKPEDISGEHTGALGFPEFGTTFVRKMLVSAKAKSFSDLISVSGLSHGTDVWNNNAEDLILKKNLQLKDIISCRDDIMVFLITKGVNELKAFQIMENVRKGKGLNSEEEQLLKAHKVSDWYIDSLNKIKYMFPKAHAAAYVMMAWRIAWFKLYYPLEFYASYFTTRADFIDIKIMSSTKKTISEKLSDFKRRRNSKGEDKLSAKEQGLITVLEIAEEMYARGFKISKISINKSEATNWIIDKESNSLIPPFNAMDGLGVAVAESIIEQRKKKPFISIEDVIERTSVNKTLNEKFIELEIYEDLNESNQTSLF
ncbi:PolC-type DNA polymerase III [[Mycoplasma] mobile]|uniref:DNA polymerase III PolC-type n=1 Tax=Mycoplasma mobile (strain ATCC 43663 / 163K / NCTC 11711) TaxID=267748 RepID=Q6KIN3_MYCM1|nr:PolC-type DNA polymerase III [[Mycoplasma] mobile]AAT27543.1 DNA polymerase III alpha subunit [Mycoplasma mobile 163K]